MIFERSQHKIWKVLENEPLFAHTKGLSHKDYRHLTYQRMKKIDEYDFFSLAKMFRKPHLGDSFLIALGNYDWSPIVKYSLLHSFEASTILGLGTEIHMAEVQRLVRREVTRNLSTGNVKMTFEYLDWSLFLFNGNWSWN